MLNSINSSANLSVDGPWGTGKTIFVKQLEFLSRTNKLDTAEFESILFTGIEKSNIINFQKNYIVYYYNAWQNDNHIDPTQSLLFSLIHDLQIKDDIITPNQDIMKQVVADSIIRFIKTLTKDFVDLESIKNASTIKTLIEDITTANERQKAINKIIETLIPKNKKLLFLIDELDRCRPSFAVGLLESVKHYYENEKTVFVISTNNKQLSHTVKKFYGNDFDGSGYLNKFYDLIYELPEIDRKTFINSHLGLKDSSHWHTALPPKIADSLEMSMREIIRYYAALKIVMNYLSEFSVHNDQIDSLTKYLYIPFALALKVTNLNMFEDFKSGRGHEYLRELLRRDSTIKRVALPFVDRTKPNLDGLLEDTIIQTYLKIFQKNNGQDVFASYELKKDFIEIINLINSTGTIDD